MLLRASPPHLCENSDNDDGRAGIVSNLAAPGSSQLARRSRGRWWQIRRVQSKSVGLRHCHCARRRWVRYAGQHPSSIYICPSFFSEQGWTHALPDRTIVCELLWKDCAMCNFTYSDCSWDFLRNGMETTMAHGFWYVVWWNSSVLLLNRFGLTLPGRFTKPRTRSRAPFDRWQSYQIYHQ